MNLNLATAITSAHNAGLCVIPTASDGSKRPAVPWKGYQDERPTAARVGDWRNGNYDGFGIICGAISGNLELFEFEAAAVESGLFDRFVDHAIASGCDFLEAIRNGYEEQTPTGGVHWLYRCDDPVEGNLKLASRPVPASTHPVSEAVLASRAVEVLIETRGEGGYVVVAPSGGRTHPNGGDWVLKRGGFPSIYSVSATQRRHLLDIARSFDQVPRPAIEIPTTVTGIADGPCGAISTTPADSTKPGHIYNRTHEWDDVLVGWERMFTDQDGETHWSRPGKSPVATSATTNYKGTDLLKVFSSSTPFSTERTYDRFGAYALLHHGGDLSAAGRAVREREPGRPVGNLLPVGSDLLSQQTDDFAGRWNEEFENWGRFWSMDHTSEEWLLPPILISGRAHALYALGKAGKSLLALEMAAALATGREILGFRPPRRYRVGYFDYEMTQSDLRERLERMYYSGADELYPYFAYKRMAQLPPLDTHEGGQAMLELARFFKLEVIFIDTTARAVVGGENDADTFRYLYRYTISPLKDAGVTTLRIDHSGKDMSRGQRGSSAKADDVDVVFQMTVKDDVVTIRCERQRPGYVPSTTVLQRHEDPLHHTIIEDPTQSSLIRRLAARLDDIGVPGDAGRVQARQLLGAWNREHSDSQVVASTDDLRLALMFRKSEAVDKSVDNLVGGPK